MLLLQLSPSLACTPEAERFLRILISEYTGPVAMEPRHLSWNYGGVEQLLREVRIARVMADPPLITDNVLATGDRTMSYYRLHDDPRMSRSVYSSER